MVTMKDIYDARRKTVDLRRGDYDYGLSMQSQMDAHDNLARAIAKEAGYDVTRPTDKTIHDITVYNKECDMKMDFECGWSNVTGNIFIEDTSRGKQSKHKKYPLLLYIYANDINPVVVRLTLVDAQKLYTYAQINLKYKTPAKTGNTGWLIRWNELEDEHGIEVRTVGVKSIDGTKDGRMLYDNERII